MSVSTVVTNSSTGQLFIASFSFLVLRNFGSSIFVDKLTFCVRD